MVYFVVAELCRSTGGSILDVKAVDDGRIPPGALLARSTEEAAEADLASIAKKYGGSQVNTTHCIGNVKELAR